MKPPVGFDPWDHGPVQGLQTDLLSGWFGVESEVWEVKGILLPTSPNMKLSYKICRSSPCPQTPQSALSQSTSPKHVIDVSPPALT